MITVLLVNLVLAGTLLSYTITVTLRTGQSELTATHERMLAERRSKLWDNMNFAYYTLQSHYDQAGNPSWIRKHYGSELERALDLAESAIRTALVRASSGEISTAAA